MIFSETIVEWQPLSTIPLGAEVWLVDKFGIQQCCNTKNYSQEMLSEKAYTHWAPKPKGPNTAFQKWWESLPQPNSSDSARLVDGLACYSTLAKSIWRAAGEAEEA